MASRLKVDYDATCPGCLVGQAKTPRQKSNAENANDCPAGLLAEAEAIFANPDAVLNGAELAVA